MSPRLRQSFNCAAQLSEDDRLDEHLKGRTISPFRQYKTTRRRKAG